MGANPTHIRSSDRVCPRRLLRAKRASASAPPHPFSPSLPVTFFLCLAPTHARASERSRPYPLSARPTHLHIGLSARGAATSGIRSSDPSIHPKSRIPPLPHSRMPSRSSPRSVAVEARARRPLSSSSSSHFLHPSEAVISAGRFLCFRPNPPSLDARPPPVLSSRRIARRSGMRFPSRLSLFPPPDPEIPAPAFARRSLGACSASHPSVADGACTSASSTLSCYPSVCARATSVRHPIGTRGTPPSRPSTSTPRSDRVASPCSIWSALYKIKFFSFLRIRFSMRQKTSFFFGHLLLSISGATKNTFFCAFDFRCGIGDQSKKRKYEK